MSITKLSIIGRQFGRLTVLRITDKRYNRRIIYECLCICGKTVLIPGASLKSGNTKSCGCLGPSFEKRPPSINWKTAANGVYESYKNRAKAHQWEFSLTLEESISLFKANCTYCGAIPYNIKYDSKRNTIFTYNGIDRVDNTQGYSLKNCVTCCRQCNTAKNYLTLEDFKSWIMRVNNYFNSRNI